MNLAFQRNGNRNDYFQSLWLNERGRIAVGKRRNTFFSVLSKLPPRTIAHARGASLSVWQPRFLSRSENNEQGSRQGEWVIKIHDLGQNDNILPDQKKKN